MASAPLLWLAVIVAVCSVAATDERAAHFASWGCHARSLVVFSPGTVHSEAAEPYAPLLLPRDPSGLSPWCLEAAALWPHTAPSNASTHGLFSTFAFEQHSLIPPQPEGIEARGRWPWVHGVRGAPSRRSHDTLENARRREKVRDALRGSWAGYKKYAWGKDEYFPLTAGSKNWGDENTKAQDRDAEANGVGCTIVDALSTLLMAGLDVEADAAIAWVEHNLTFDKNIEVSHFEAMIRIGGGLLSAYQITGRPRLLELAEDLGRRLSPAYLTPTRLPYNFVNLRHGTAHGASWVSNDAVLSEFGLGMEYFTLAHEAQSPGFWERALGNVQSVLGACITGYCQKTYDVSSGNGKRGFAGLGSFGDSFYEYLLKLWMLHGGHLDGRHRDAARDAEEDACVMPQPKPPAETTGGLMDTIRLVLGSSPNPTTPPRRSVSETTAAPSAKADAMRDPPPPMAKEAAEDAQLFKGMWDSFADRTEKTSKRNGNLFIPNGKETDNQMEHLACFSGGLFALSYMTSDREPALSQTESRLRCSPGIIKLRPDRVRRKSSGHLEIAEDIAATCHALYNHTPTGLAPDVARIDPTNGAIHGPERKYILRPETVETYFYLWRATKDQKYRDWGWEVFEAIDRSLRVEEHPNGQLFFGAPGTRPQGPTTLRGYVGAADVYTPAQHQPPASDNMETFWFSETLKYLFLLFSDDEAIDLDRWVFNTEGHPLKVRR